MLLANLMPVKKKDKYVKGLFDSFRNDLSSIKLLHISYNISSLSSVYQKNAKKCLLECFPTFFKVISHVSIMFSLDFNVTYIYI